MIRCLVVDDEPNATLLIEAYIGLIPSLHCVGRCHEPSEALKILNTKNIDLLFLDIRMPGMDGFELLRALNNVPRVIIITAHQEYAIFGYQFDVLDYLLKPVSFDLFQKAVGKYSTIEKPKPQQELGDSFYIKDDYKLTKVRLKEILFIESFREYVHLHTRNRKHIFRKTLKEMEQKLQSKRFLRVHKSYIVALSTVDAVEGNRIQIQSHKIPIGKSYKDRFFNELNVI